MIKTTLNNLTILLGLLIIFYSCNKNNENEESYLFLSEEYAPFNFTNNEQAQGLAVELLNSICNDLEINSNVEFLKWDEAYNKALKTDNAILFSTVLNEERRDQFKWAGPFASLDWNLYSISENQIEINSIEDAKAGHSIGVIKGYATEELLLSKGFTNLVYCNDIKDGFSRLLNGEIDLFPTDKYTAKSELETLGKTIYAIRNSITLKTELIYFAFNRSISDEQVAKFQKAIDNKKQDGTLEQLSVKYLETNSYPDVIQFYTEPYPPLTFVNDKGEISGFGTEVVREIMKRNETFYKINLSSWSNGYQLALNNPNFCLFTMDRTAIREDLFQWVGPVGTNTTWFYTSTTSGISIKSIDDAKSLSKIGTVDSWFSTQYLQEQGFTNLIKKSDPVELTQMLMNGEIDAFVCTDVTFPSILNEAGFDFSEVKSQVSIMASDYYIAFSNNTDLEISSNWQSKLEAIKADGTYQAIHEKWFPF